jgi:Holliday junction resolvase
MDAMKNCFAIGTKAEREFADILKRKGYKITWANKYQNIHAHWDLMATKKNERYRVDVKSAKKINRSDKYVQYEMVWVELSNVNSDKGWAYGGSDFIAFQVRNGFFVIRTPRLLSITIGEIENGAYVKTRNGRKDVIALISMDSIIEVGKFVR